MLEDRNAKFREILRKNPDMSTEQKKKIFIEVFANKLQVDTQELNNISFLKRCLKEVDIQTLKENRDFFVQILNDNSIAVPEYMERGKEIGDFIDNMVTVLFLNNGRHIGFLHEYFPSIAKDVDKALATRYKNEVLNKQLEFGQMNEDERNKAKILLYRAIKLTPWDGELYGYRAKLEESGIAYSLNNIEYYYKKAYEMTRNQDWKKRHDIISKVIEKYKKELESEDAKQRELLPIHNKDDIVLLYRSILCQVDYLIGLGQYGKAQDKCSRALKMIALLKDDKILRVATDEVNNRRDKISFAEQSVIQIADDEIYNSDDIDYTEKYEKVQEIINFRNDNLDKEWKSIDDIMGFNILGTDIANIYESIGKEELALDIYNDNIERIEKFDNMFEYSIFKRTMLAENMIRKAKVLNILSQKDKMHRDYYKRQEIEEYTKILKTVDEEDSCKISAIVGKINALIDIGNNQEALHQCDKALAMYEYKDELQILSNKAKILLNMGNKEEALYVYMNMSKIDMSNSDMVEALSSNITMEEFKNVPKDDDSIITALLRLRDNLPDNLLEKCYINKAIYKLDECSKKGDMQGLQRYIWQIENIVGDILENSDAIITSKNDVLRHIKIERYKHLLSRLSKEHIKNQVLQIINLSDNNMKGRMPIATLCANIFTVLKEQTSERYKDDEHIKTYEDSQEATLECIIKNKKEVYHKNIAQLKPNDTKSFVIAPIFAKGHMFSTIIYKTNEGYDCIVVNKGSRSGHHKFEKYSITSNKIDNIVNLFGYNDNTDVLEIEKVYDIFSNYSNRFERITDIEAREQIVGNCYEKEVEEAVKLSTAIAFGTYEKMEFPKFNLSEQFYVSEVKIPKWLESTQDMHVKMLSNIKKYCQDKELINFMDETIGMYESNKEFRTKLKDNRNISNEQKKELFIKSFNAGNTVDIDKLKDVNFLKECLKGVTSETLRENRDFFQMLFKEGQVIIPQFLKQDMEVKDFEEYAIEMFVNGDHAKQFLYEYFPAIGAEVNGILVDYYDDNWKKIDFDMCDENKRFMEFNRWKIRQAKKLLDKQIELNCSYANVYTHRAKLEELSGGDKDLNMIRDCYKRAYEIDGGASAKEEYKKVLEEIKSKTDSNKVLEEYDVAKSRCSNANIDTLEDSKQNLFECTVKVMEQAGISGDVSAIEKYYNDAMGLIKDEYYAKLGKVRIDTLFDATIKAMERASRLGEGKTVEESYNYMLDVLQAVHDDINLNDNEMNEYRARLEQAKLEELLESAISIMEKASKLGDCETVEKSYVYTTDVLRHVNIDGNKKDEYQDRLMSEKQNALERLKDVNSPLRNVNMSKGVEDYKQQLINCENELKKLKASNSDILFIINVMETKADILNVLAQVDRDEFENYKIQEIETYNEILNNISKDEIDTYLIVNNKIDALVELGESQAALDECKFAFDNYKEHIAEILYKMANILACEGLEINEEKNKEQRQLEIYEKLCEVDPDNRIIRNRLIDIQRKLIGVKIEDYLNYTTQIEERIFNIQDMNKKRGKFIAKIIRTLLNNKEELDVAKTKLVIKKISSYYETIATSMVNTFPELKQDVNIEDNNKFILMCMERIYNKLDKFENQKMQLNKQDLAKRVNNVIGSIINDINKINKCNEDIDKICNRVISDYLVGEDKMLDSMLNKKELKVNDFVIKDYGEFAKRLNIISKKINISRSMGMQQEVLDGFEAVLKLSPNDLISLNGKAIILEDMGNKEDALKVYRQMLKIDSDNKQLKLKIRNVSNDLGKQLNIDSQTQTGFKRRRITKDDYKRNTGLDFVK